MIKTYKLLISYPYLSDTYADQKAAMFANITDYESDLNEIIYLLNGLTDEERRIVGG